MVLAELAYLAVTSVFCDSMLKVLVWMEAAPQTGCVSKARGWQKTLGACPAGSDSVFASASEEWRVNFSLST